MSRNAAGSATSDDAVENASSAGPRTVFRKRTGGMRAIHITGTSTNTANTMRAP